MKAIKSLDFFQKISTDDVIKPTVLGSIISLSAIFLIFYLLFREFLDFLSPSLKAETIVYHDPDQFSKINVNLGINFRDMPCNIISVDQQDSIGNHRMDIKDTLNKKILSKGDLFKGGKPYIPATGLTFNEVEESINKSEGCFVSGYVPVSKVSGNIHISHHNYGSIYKHLKYQKKELFDKINFTHNFFFLFFGTVDLNQDILERFGFNENTAFNRVNILPDYTNDKEKKNYDYFIKLIPHIFVDNIKGEKYQAYQYSITSKSSDFDSHSEGMPIVTLHYDFSPITMKIALERKSITHTLVHVCAIVGGVYVLFSLINRMLLAFVDWLNDEKKS